MPYGASANAACRVGRCNVERKPMLHGAFFCPLYCHSSSPVLVFLVQAFARLVILSDIPFPAVPLPANSQTKDSRLSHFLTYKTQKKMRQDITENKMAELTDDRRLLVISHMPLAYAMAWRMRDYGVSLEDLRQEGCIGLCEAAMRYDESQGCRFATYAAHWCRKMMLMAIYRYGAPMRLPERERNAIRFYRLDNGENPQAGEKEADEDLLRAGQLRRIDEALGCLTPTEQQIIAQSFGIDTERLSLTEIATGLGISKARASVLHSRALRKLEAELRKRPLVDYLTQ